MKSRLSKLIFLMGSFALNSLAMGQKPSVHNELWFPQAVTITMNFNGLPNQQQLSSNTKMTVSYSPLRGTTEANVICDNPNGVTQGHAISCHITSSGALNGADHQTAVFNFSVPFMRQGMQCSQNYNVGIVQVAPAKSDTPARKVVCKFETSGGSMACDDPYTGGISVVPNGYCRSHGN